MEISFCIDNKTELKKFLNESSYIFLYRNKIIKKKKGKKRHFNFNGRFFKISLGLSLIWIGIFINFIQMINTLSVSKLLTDRNTIFLVAVSILWIIWLKTINKTNKEQQKLLNEKIVLTINEEKIKLSFIEKEISTTIENITAIIIGKYSINIVTNNNIVFNVPIVIKDKVINAINKYRNNILIIELK